MITQRNNIQIRRATIQDAEWIATVHVNSWLTSYKWLIDQSHLDNIDTNEYRIKKIAKREEIINRWSDILYVTTDGEKIVWFVCGWKQREEKLDVEWELYAIYLLEDYKWMWIWWKLFKQLRNELSTLWYKSFWLRALSTNDQANWFYEYMWWQKEWKDIYKIWDSENDLSWWVFEIDKSNPVVFHLIWHVGVWKSTVAKYLIEKYDFIQVNGDIIWKAMSKEPNYESKEEQEEVYKRAEQLIRKSLQWKKNVVLETFGMTEESRNFAQKITVSGDWIYQQVEVVWPKEDVLKERIISRYNGENRDSDGDRNVYLKLKSQWEESKSDRIIIKNQWIVDDLYKEIDAIVAKRSKSK